MGEEVVGKGRVSTSLLMEELHFDNINTEVNCQYVPERISSMTQWRLKCAMINLRINSQNFLTKGIISLVIFVILGAGKCRKMFFRVFHMHCTCSHV